MWTSKYVKMYVAKKTKILLIYLATRYAERTVAYATYSHKFIFVSVYIKYINKY